jgi:hypothetical protein
LNSDKWCFSWVCTPVFEKSFIFVF